MTRRRLSARTEPGEHRRLARRYHHCPRGGSRAARLKELVQFVARSLRSAKRETETP